MHWKQIDWRYFLRTYACMFAGVFAGYLLTLPLAIFFAIQDKSGMGPLTWDEALGSLFQLGFWIFVPVALGWSAVVALPSVRIINRSRVLAGIACGIALGVYYAFAFFPFMRGLDAWEWLTGLERTGSRASYHLLFYLLIPIAMTAAIASLVVLAGRITRLGSPK